MNDFAAIDFETANSHRKSVCSVGIVIVRNQEVSDTFYELIRPALNYYCDWATEIHGLTHHDTERTDPFPVVWREIAPALTGLPLVTHNSPFVESCLRSVFEYYGMLYPDYDFFVRADNRAKYFRNYLTIGWIRLQDTSGSI